MLTPRKNVFAPFDQALATAIEMGKYVVVQKELDHPERKHLPKRGYLHLEGSNEKINVAAWAIVHGRGSLAADLVCNEQVGYYLPNTEYVANNVCTLWDIKLTTPTPCYLGPAAIALVLGKPTLAATLAQEDDNSMCFIKGPHVYNAIEYLGEIHHLLKLPPPSKEVVTNYLLGLPFETIVNEALPLVDKVDLVDYLKLARYYTTITASSDQKTNTLPIGILTKLARAKIEVERDKTKAPAKTCAPKGPRATPTGFRWG